MATHGYAHVLLAVETALGGAVAGENVVLLQHFQHKRIGIVWRQNLAQEIVGLRRHHTQETDFAKFLLEIVALGNEFIACLEIFVLVFRENLHKELGKRIDVPNAHHLLHTADDVGVGGAENAQANARHAITLRNALHHQHVGICLQNVVVQQRVVEIALAEVHKTLIHNQPNLIRLAPSRQFQNVGFGNEVARRVVGVDEDKIVGVMLAEEID